VVTGLLMIPEDIIIFAGIFIIHLAGPVAVSLQNEKLIN